MANVEKISVSLSDELVKMVKNAVNEGDYTSSSEVIREALRDWKIKRLKQDAELVLMQKALREGLADIDALNTEPADEIFERLTQKYS